MKLIILSITEYKEKDGIVTAFNNEGVKTFRAPGVLSPHSKNGLINNPLTLIDATLSESKTSKYLTLKEAEVLYSPLSGDMSIPYLTGIAILNEVTIKLLDDEEKPLVYQDLLNATIALKNKINPYLISLKYILRVISLTGYALDVNHCVRCGEKQNMVAFSFIEGGFICGKCITSEDKNDLDIPEMRLVRNVYITKDYLFEQFKFDEKIAVSLLKKLNIFIADAYGGKINAIDMI